MDSLPDELIDIICQYVNTPAKGYKAPDNPSTYKLSLVSRRLNRIASTHLYSSLRLSLKHRRNYATLLQALINRPSRQNMIKRIYATLDDPGSKYAQGYSIWSEDLNRIFRLLDRLECLETEHVWGMQFLMLRSNDTTQSLFLPSLKVLRLNAVKWNFPTMEYFLRLPRLQSLVLDPFRLTCHSPRDCEFALGTNFEWMNSPVKHLSLHSIDYWKPQPAHTTFLKRYFSSFTKLETLSIHVSATCFGPDACRYLMGLFSTQLQTSLRRLEFLEVTLDKGDGEANTTAQWINNNAALDYLQASNIEYLKIEVDCLGAPDQFWFSENALQEFKIPPSVRHVVLWDTKQHHLKDQDLEEYDKYGIAELFRQKLPNLDLLQLGMALKEDGMLLVKAFGEELAAVGIKMEMNRCQNHKL